MNSETLSPQSPLISKEGGAFSFFSSFPVVCQCVTCWNEPPSVVRSLTRHKCTRHCECMFEKKGTLMLSTVPDTCWIKSAEKRLASTAENRNSCKNRTHGGAAQGCVKEPRLENTVETSPAHNGNKYTFNFELHNNHLRIKTIRNKQISA